MRASLLALLAAACAASCGSGHEKICVKAPENQADWKPQLANAEPGTKVPPDDAKTIREIVAETRRIITGEAFARHVMAFRGDDQLKASTTGTLYDGRVVLGAYLGMAPDPRPLRVTILGDAVRDPVAVAHTGLDGNATEPTMHLSPIVLERWRRGTAVARSCAINTIAHELTHTVFWSDGNRPGEVAFADGSYMFMWLFGGRHIVSYALGTVAQCTYLEEREVEAYAYCVSVHGTTSFSPCGCDG